ncbi:exinuclease ABC system, subunit C [Gottschalkia purinilytica]|uniref:Exinuclease ABC system, subunit C n=1 Tax=Gottschalkia purinilytica TaxID=1503 RepID=A0A0L0W862_GOTPU|nr:GIY-YIG nuclease family protein [Gottschalkia purinilytica]KNF07637.1 exinuclease ABC system, subunit C [Gottschalkia purinilytica]
MSKIPEHLIEKVKAIPSKPGIYQMKDMYGYVMYIGKSKTLQSRVKSYFYTDHKQNKIERMVFHIHDIDVIVTDTHLEAQILECALIKKMKPIYNSQMKNDNKYVYLKIESNHRLKPLSIVHKRENEHCIGPYRSKSKLIKIIEFFQNIYPITKCDNLYKFTYKVLPESLDREDFEKNKECLEEILYKEECMKTFLSQISEKMDIAASKFQFETASAYRDILENIKYLHDNYLNQIKTLEYRKILMGEQIDDGYKVFYISNNRIVLKKKYKGLTKDIVEDFLKQADKLDKQVSYIMNEKRDLDFKKIIYTEIKDDESKSILYIDDDYCIDQFINKLIKSK